MIRRIKNIQDVVDWGLCIGCGACRAACENKGVDLENVLSLGVRPRFDRKICTEYTSCLDTCPGYSLDARDIPQGMRKSSEGDHEFGPALEIWEGYAADPDIRYRASSGGILSALALYCIEKKGMGGVLHSGMDKDSPWLNKTYFSKTRQNIVDRTGSRYAPSSPCEALADAEKEINPFVFIGKPCDAAAAYMLRRKRPLLDSKIGLSLSFFCAGTPSVRGTMDLIQSFSIPLEKVSSVRYRGNGWPGNFEVVFNADQKHCLSYQDSWGRLTRYRPFRCNICPDGLGRFADITCGDAWHKHTENAEEPGRSLVLVRTPRGREILHEAIKDGYVKLWPSDQKAVLSAQNNLLERRRDLYGRLLGMALMGVPLPDFKGFSLRSSWKKKKFFEKTKIIAGTARRILRRGMWKRQPIQWDAARVLPVCDSKSSNTANKQDGASTRQIL